MPHEFKRFDFFFHFLFEEGGLGSLLAFEMLILSLLYPFSAISTVHCKEVVFQIVFALNEVTIVFGQ